MDELEIVQFFGSPSIGPLSKGRLGYCSETLISLFTFDMCRCFNGQLMCHVAFLFWLNFVVSDYATCHDLIDQPVASIHFLRDMPRVNF